MSPSQVWSEFDVAEVLCGIYGETELGTQSLQEAKGSSPRQWNGAGHNGV